MIFEILFLSGAVVMAAGVGQIVGRRRRTGWTTEGAVREAMRGSEGGAVRAEYRQSGIIPPERRRTFVRGGPVF